jgi:hypothetical protein
MKFTSKQEAYNFLRTKHLEKTNLTEDEKQAVSEYFTAEQLTDLSFDHINMNDCFSHHLS